MAGALATATMVVHFAALVYIGFGGFLAWRWPRAALVHVFFVAWGVAVNVIPGLPCPLTALEDHFREQQGLSALSGGFNEFYIYDEIVPRDLLPLAAVIGILAVVVSYAGLFLILRRRRSLTRAESAR